MKTTISILIILIVLLVGCQVENSQPAIDTTPDNSIAVGEPNQDSIPQDTVKNAEETQAEPEPQEIKSNLTTIFKNIKLPPAPSATNFCKINDSYEGISPDGIVGADIVGIVTFKEAGYCKAFTKWDKDNINYEYTFYFQGSNAQVWLERNVDGNKESIHVMQDGKLLS